MAPDVARGNVRFRWSGNLGGSMRTNRLFCENTGETALATMAVRGTELSLQCTNSRVQSRCQTTSAANRTIAAFTRNGAPLPVATPDIAGEWFTVNGAAEIESSSRPLMTSRGIDSTRVRALPFDATLATPNETVGVGSHAMRARVTAGGRRRATSPRRVRVESVLTLVALVACAGSRGAAPESKGKPAAEQEMRQSARLGYRWMLPANWGFISLEQFGVPDSLAGAEMFAAAKIGDDVPVTVLIATDVAASPNKDWGNGDLELMALELGARELLRQGDVEPQTSRRVRMAGRDGIEVSGAKGEQVISVRSVLVGRRKFLFMCFAYENGDDWPCEPAYASLVFREMPREPAETETPRVLHLRDDRLGFAFDPPSDAFLAVGPRIGQGGLQSIWVWKEGDRSIDLGVSDLSQTPEPPDQSAVAAKWSRVQTDLGATVEIERAPLGGLSAHHLLVKRPDGLTMDLYTLNRGSVNYTIMVLQKTHDKAFIDRVRRGFRFLTPVEP